jgi:hypothetical protein
VPVHRRFAFHVAELDHRVLVVVQRIVLFSFLFFFSDLKRVRVFACGHLVEGQVL